MSTKDMRIGPLNAANVQALIARAAAAEAKVEALTAALRKARHELDHWVFAGQGSMRVERAEAILDAALATSEQARTEAGA